MDKSDEKSGLVKKKGKRSEREMEGGERDGESNGEERRKEGGGWSHLKRLRGGEEEMSEGQGEVRRNAVTVDRGPVPRAQVLQSPTGTTKNEQNGDRVAQPRVHAQARHIFARAIHRTVVSVDFHHVFQHACRPCVERDFFSLPERMFSFFSEFLLFFPLPLVTLPLPRMES